MRRLSYRGCAMTADERTAIETMLAALDERDAQIACLREALKPFALAEDERFELGSFEDEELIFMRPDDGNDSVKNGWRKTVTIGDTRRASEAVRGNA